MWEECGGRGRDGRSMGGGGRGRKTGNVACILPVQHEKCELPYMALSSNALQASDSY